MERKKERVQKKIKKLKIGPREAEAILRGLGDGVSIQDRNFRIIYQNEVMQKIFGNQIGRYCYNIYERRDQVCEKCPVEIALSTGKINTSLRVGIDKDGRSGYYENTASPIRDEKGNIIAAVEIVRNVSDRVRLEEDVKDRTNELAQANIKLRKLHNELEQKVKERTVELQARLNDLSIVYEMDRQISAKLHLSDILEYVINSVPEVMEAEICAIFLWNEVRAQLIPKMVTGLSPEGSEEIPFLLGEGLEGWVGLERRQVNVLDVSVDPRWKDKLPYPVHKVKTALFCPILMGEKLLGVIGLINKARGRAFNHSDESLLTAIAGQLAVAMENATLYERVRDLSLGTIRSLAMAIDARDPYTRGHSEEVAKYAVIIAKVLNYSLEKTEMIEIAGLLHDTGKIGISGEILKKPGPLTHEDWDKIRLHPYLSRKILIPVESLHSIIPWIYHHHERYDGTGYPDGINGEKIPLEAKILAVADAFSALTSDRPYRKAKTKHEAIEELRKVSGTQLDPKIVEIFIKALAKESEG